MKTKLRRSFRASIIEALIISTQCLFVNLNAQAANDSEIHAHAQSTEWLNLLHYRRHTFSGLQSEIDSLSFFISPVGKKNATAEWEATLKLLKSKPMSHCLYPARAEHFSRNGIYKSDLNQCTELQNWIKILSVRSG